jgi:chromosome segregation protein
VPISFARLRIAGFKSFAEPATVDIHPGLTGIVGPNGCGKSNVVEALRWAMGENSARSMRGGEMDDVIFAGTAARPSRNIAEVMLLLDDAKGVAPPPFHESPELEVIRRIERGRGSVYRVNGREARARDVQTLFADLATGAHSSGMVSQGRVASIVNAKPADRRVILEEAAGITGLHARRHEAELKLRAAEANLSRAEDLRGQLESQLENLKKQARQANRYKNISGHIRNAEAELLSIQRARVEELRTTAEAALHGAKTAVAEATSAATAATTHATETAAALPALRTAEAEARTILERHRIAGEQLAAEAERAQSALAAAAERHAQLDQDFAHAEQARNDSAAALARLAEEDSRLAAEDESHPPRFAHAEQQASLEADAVRATEAEANRATEHAADLAARHRSLTEALAFADQRARRLAEQVARIAEERARAAAQLIDPARLQQAETTHQAAQEAAEQARAALEQAEHARATALHQAQHLRATARAAAEQARALATQLATQARAAAHATLVNARAIESEAESRRTRLATEEKALRDVLGIKDNELWPKMVDQLTVPPGLEAALGAALGEELESGADSSAARHWDNLPPLDPVPALPAGAQPLSSLVQAPPALTRALSQIGLIADGAAAQSTLLPGQTLVSPEGAIWRWDGYTIHAGTPTAAAVRLQQRNRLATLSADLAVATTQAEAAHAARAAAEAAERTTREETQAAERAAHAEADQADRAARGEAESLERTTAEAEQRARTLRRDAEQALERARTEAARLEKDSATATARLTGLDDQAARIAAEHAEAAAALTAATEARDSLPDPAAARAAMEEARTALSAARLRESTARADRDSLGRAAAARTHRRRAIATDRHDWEARQSDATGRVSDLETRRNAAAAEHAALVAAPTEIAARRATAMDALEQTEAHHRQTADALLAAESAATTADRTARAAESTLSTAREQVARLEGEAATAEQARAAIAERILERLGENPSLPDPPADIGPESEEKARKRLDRLQREREEMGPVNLRAEVEAEELSTQIDTIVREREELTTAIAKLRGSIGNLNREGRERLSAVFEQVDKHFQTLFTRMFGGGRAHLALVGSDDPLEAGLEIYAQPPGKKLATLSLLSGGEQALTALSLIFAVFRCNPAPVCVLDEVDAPLDDANVERFCTLLEDMVRETGTRFLVVTHHHLTMSRMDRLYGVTMQERGVSRLLSVDLQRAAEMVDAPRMAAE